MKKIVNGVLLDMTPEEEAAFIDSITPRFPAAKREARQAVLARAIQELDEDNLLDLANPNARIAAVRANARQLRQDINACTTVAEVLAIDIGAGW